MKTSPFPGMDPYLESHWGDIHQRIITYSSDALQRALPDDLLARVEERVYVESDEGVRLWSIGPDTRIHELKGTSVASSLSSNGVAVAEPQIFMKEQAEEITEGSIVIREADGARVITIIEFLSPANKAGGEGTRLYKQKQADVLRSESSLVEIDLIRDGQRVLMLRPHRIPFEFRDYYLACICRGWRPQQIELYAISLRERLPALPIPLRPHEAPIALDLQAILDQCYENGRYSKLDYRRPCEPTLKREDLVWAEDLLKEAGMQ